ncbi:MAG: hypothetical protein HYU27_01925 [Acidobacteria bacterium]|nr:hypothetical protein [Acidobacteriota bacterium]
MSLQKQVQAERGQYLRCLEFAAAFFFVLFKPYALALDPTKSLGQYSRTVWTQAQGLYQDTIRAIAQTKDGYLWLASDEGLIRFDGYQFVTFSKANSDLQDNSITALAASADGSLWIGTRSSLVRYRDQQFQTYYTTPGLPEDFIYALIEDHVGKLWSVSGSYLSRYQDGKFTNFTPAFSMRSVHEDRRHELWIGGAGVLARLVDGKFVPVIESAALDGETVRTILADRHDNLWIGTDKELIKRSPSGKISRYGQRDGNLTVRALLEDRDGNIWVASSTGLGRIEGNRFVKPSGAGFQAEPLFPLCIFEDREGNLWAGSTGGLNRFKDNAFTAYGISEGLPSDEPTTVFQDHEGRVWVGFREQGLMLFSPEGRRLFTQSDGLPDNEILSVGETRAGELLIGTSSGLARLRVIHSYSPHHPLADQFVLDILSTDKPAYDVLEDSAGSLWVAAAGGLIQLHGKEAREVIVRSLPPNVVRTLAEGPDGVIWAGTTGKGLWRVDGGHKRLFTVADGLSSDRIYALNYDADGTLWIGTFGGGLSALRDGRFLRFTARDGLLSDNIANLIDDGDSLWLSTTLGICRIAKQQLRDFAENKRTFLEPVNYGINDGLRSTHVAPNYRTVGGEGGIRASDGQLWFTTRRGLAVFISDDYRQRVLPPIVQVENMIADARPVDLRSQARLSLKSGQIEFRYTAIHLTAPEALRYSYKLDGLDTEWVKAGARRTVSYSNLRHGLYRFMVKAESPDGLMDEKSFAFVLLPRFYETMWFRLLSAVLLIAALWAAYRLRVRQVRYRFELVLQERVRLAREIHDTLAQDIFGVSTQLEALASQMPEEEGTPRRKHLDVARRMARHCLTETRRAIMDLRSPALEERDLATALDSSARTWLAGSGVELDMEIARPPSALPRDMVQHLLRIAQEAVNNSLKYAGAGKICIRLRVEARNLCLQIADDGRGFEPRNAVLDGHFGLIGMRERAKRLGGELRLSSRPGAGTCIDVVVPLL